MAESAPLTPELLRAQCLEFQRGEAHCSAVPDPPCDICQAADLWAASASALSECQQELKALRGGGQPNTPNKAGGQAIEPTVLKPPSTHSTCEGQEMDQTWATFDWVTDEEACGIRLRAERAEAALASAEEERDRLKDLVNARLIHVTNNVELSHRFERLYELGLLQEKLAAPPEKEPTP